VVKLYGFCASAPSLHRESTDSLITYHINKKVYKFDKQNITQSLITQLNVSHTPANSVPEL